MDNIEFCLDKAKLKYYINAGDLMENGKDAIILNRPKGLTVEIYKNYHSKDGVVLTAITFGDRILAVESKPTDEDTWICSLQLILDASDELKQITGY